MQYITFRKFRCRATYYMRVFVFFRKKTFKVQIFDCGYFRVSFSTLSTLWLFTTACV